MHMIKIMLNSLKLVAYFYFYSQYSRTNNNTEIGIAEYIIIGEVLDNYHIVVSIIFQESKGRVDILW